MMRNSYVITLCMIMVSCSNERLYQILGSPDPQGPPTIYPLNFPLCPLQWGLVVVPLQIVIYREVFPEPEYLMNLVKRNPEEMPCDLLNERHSSAPYHIRNKDHWEGVAGFDKSGQGYFAASNYHFNLMNNDTFLENERKQRNYEEFQLKKLIRDGYATKRFLESEEIFMINGLEWRHQVIGRYERITSFDPENPRNISDRTGIFDVYEHHFDESHVFQIKGHYGEIILANPELLEDRRRMTRRLVEGFRYEFLTPEQIELIDGPRG